VVRQVRLESTWARAVVPVAAGIGFFAVVGLFLWGIAALLSGNETQTLIGSRTFTPGPARVWAASIDRDGPILFADLSGTTGDQSVVLDHQGDDPERGWRLYLAHPADRPLTCKIAQEPRTANFTDCEGRALQVDQLALPPQGVGPAVSNDGVLSLDLVPAQPDNGAPGTTGS
jgi:hypothetical protein